MVLQAASEELATKAQNVVFMRDMAASWVGCLCVQMKRQGDEGVPPIFVHIDGSPLFGFSTG
jgi:hypothetical protein